MRKLGLVAFLVLLMGQWAYADTIVFDTTHNKTSIFQNTGNARSGLGSQIIIAGTTGFITEIQVPTNTFRHFATPAYTPAFLEVTLYLNNGPADSSSSDPFVNSSPDDSSPGPGPGDGTRAGTVPFAKSRVPGPAYPAGGNHNTGGITVSFPFDDILQGHNALGTLVTGSFTWQINNLNAAGEVDGANPDGNQWGIYRSGDLFDPETEEFIAPGGTVVGTHQRSWTYYNGPRNSPTQWESGGPTSNSGSPFEVTVFANPVPEPSTIVLGAFGLLGLAVVAVRRRKSA